MVMCEGTAIVEQDCLWHANPMPGYALTHQPDGSPCMTAPMDETARDAQWMRQTAAGDIEAFECLVNEHKARVVGTVAKMLGDSTEAEDIAQEVFVRVWKSAKRYRPSAKFSTWLMAITRNLVFNETRRRRRKPSETIEAREPRSQRQFADDSAASPADEALQAELEAEVQAAIEALPEAQRMALVLRRYEDMPYEDIAAVLRTSVSSVKSLLFRARTDLRQRLDRYLRP